MPAPDRPQARCAPRARQRLTWGPALLVVATACARPPATGAARRPLPPLALDAAHADSVRSERIADGVVLHRLWLPHGPQAVQLLDVDRAACWTLAARKAGSGAVGRAGTLALVRGLADSVPRAVAGGVNADFFGFTPPGVPVGPHVQDGRLISGPVARPAFALDSAGLPWIGVLRVAGSVVAGADTLPLRGWNRAAPGGLTAFDGAWGARTDSVPGRVLVTLHAVGGDARSARVRAVVTAVDSGDVGAVPVDGLVLAVGAQAAPTERARLVALRPGRDTLTVTRALTPVRPRVAVGGLPVLLRGGAIDAQVDSVGNAGFRGVNPRTAVAVANDGRRLLLVTADGRQPGRSVGMSLRDLATLLQALGARDALNLDGGGSTTMVVRDAVAGFRIANTPSDSAGARPVGNALVVVADGCERR